MKCIITIYLFFFFVLLCEAQSGTLTDTRDGKVYKTVQIGSQTWMAENLAYAPLISFVTHDSYLKTGIYCYNDDTALITDYGLLYSWSIAIKSCPVGWHLPTKAEYDTLLAYVGSDAKIVYEHLRVGGSIGFEAKFGGYLFFSSREVGCYVNLNNVGDFWTSTGKNKRTTTDFYYLTFNHPMKESKMEVNNKFMNASRVYPLCHSVRCIKD